MGRFNLRAHLRCDYSRLFLVRNNSTAFWRRARGKSQFCIAGDCTRHVTYFFNGGIERAFEHEDRKIALPKAAPTTCNRPGAARLVTDELLARMANCDHHPEFRKLTWLGTLEWCFKGQSG